MVWEEYIRIDFENFEGAFYLYLLVLFFLLTRIAGIERNALIFVLKDRCLQFLFKTRRGA